MSDVELQKLPALFNRQEWTEIVDRLHIPPQQSEAIRLMLAGLTTEEIAEEMSLAVATVRMHFRLLFKRLSVKSRIGLAVHVFMVYRNLIGNTDAKET